MRYAFAPAQVVPSGSDGGLIAAARPQAESVRTPPEGVTSACRASGFCAEQREPDMAKGPAWIKYAPVLICAELFA